MKNYLIILILFITSACSLFISRKNKNYEYIVSQSSSYSNVEQIESGLTQKSSMGGGNYIVSVIPLTKPLLSARAKEISYKTGLKEDEVLGQYLKKYFNSRTCFDVSYTVVETDMVNDLKRWKFEFIDQHDISYDLEVINQKSPVKFMVGRGFRKIPEWLGAALICSPRKLVLRYGFDFKLKVNFIAWPFSDELILTWLVRNPDLKASTIIKKKKIQKYRGW